MSPVRAVVTNLSSAAHYMRVKRKQVKKPIGYSVYALGDEAIQLYVNPRQS